MRLSLITVLLLTVSACGGLANRLRVSRQDTLRERAAFELQCPANEILITPLDNDARSHGGGATGVSGCGRQATYIWDPHGTGWVLNSAEN